MNLINGICIRRLLGSNQDTINCEFTKEVSLNFLKSVIKVYRKWVNYDSSPSIFCNLAAFLKIIYEV